MTKTGQQKWHEWDTQTHTHTPLGSCYAINATQNIKIIILVLINKFHYSG